MNILINGVSSKYSDEWISNLLSQIDINECIAIVGEYFSAEKSEVELKYASLVLNRRELEICDYSNFKNIISEAPPVDEGLLNSMAKYEKQIFWMMERCTSVEYNEKWSVYIQHVRFWNYILESHDIKLFISPSIPHEVFDYVIYLLCKIKGIKVVSSFLPSYYNRFYVISDIYNQLPNFDAEYRCLFEEYANIAVDDIKLRPDIAEMYDYYTGSGDRTPYYMKTSEPVFNFNFENYLYNHFQIVKNIIRIKRMDTSLPSVRYIWGLYYRLMLLLNVIKRMFSFTTSTYKWFEKVMYRDRIFHEDDVAFSYYNNNIVDVDYNRNYIYVALHMQPENSSSPLGGVFVDQVLMIEMLSYYLPEKWVIYVKEHPAQGEQGVRMKSSYRAMRFYERMKACPNVEFVSLNEDTYKLMANAKAVATLTGTVGLEAITQGIPCFMFGYSYLQYAPNVFHIRNNDDCEKAFKLLDSNKDIDEDYYKKLKLYFKGLEKYVFEGTTEYYLITEEEQIKSQNALVKHFSEIISATCF